MFSRINITTNESRRIIDIWNFDSKQCNFDECKNITISFIFNKKSTKGISTSASYTYPGTVTDTVIFQY